MSTNQKSACYFLEEFVFFWGTRQKTKLSTLHSQNSGKNVIPSSGAKMCLRVFPQDTLDPSCKTFILCFQGGFWKSPEVLPGDMFAKV